MLSELLSVNVLLVVTIGMFIGLVFGATPGLGPPITLALMIPLLDHFTTPVALLLMGSMYVTGVYGGSISAILMNIPGTGASACTTFDGYPMTKRGEAITALSISTTASIIGGLVAAIIVILSVPVLSSFILLFGAPEYFLLTVMGIVVIAVVSQGKLQKGLISGFLGLMITVIGFTGTTGSVRYTYGSVYLYDGVQYIPALIGIFAVTEMMVLSGQRDQISKSSALSGKKLDGVKAILHGKINTIRSSICGLLIGAIPGAGGTVANFVAYGISKSADQSKSEYDFGEGNPQGIVSAESSNNSMVSGSLIPTLTFGIPGNSTTAVMLGGLIYLGLQPGPTLFTNNVDSVYILLAGIVIGCLFLLSMYWLAQYFSKVTTIDKAVLIPSILAISVIGTYSVRFSYGDIIQMLLFGVLGYIMIRHNYSIIALLLGIILGPTAEDNLHRTLQIGGDSLWIFFDRPASIAIILITLLFILTSVVDLKPLMEKYLPI